MPGSFSHGQSTRVSTARHTSWRNDKGRVRQLFALATTREQTLAIHPRPTSRARRLVDMYARLCANKCLIRAQTGRRAHSRTHKSQSPLIIIKLHGNHCRLRQREGARVSQSLMLFCADLRCEAAAAVATLAHNPISLRFVGRQALGDQLVLVTCLSNA